MEKFTLLSLLSYLAFTNVSITKIPNQIRGNAHMSNSRSSSAIKLLCVNEERNEYNPTNNKMPFPDEQVYLYKSSPCFFESYILYSMADNLKVKLYTHNTIVK
jgi:hypothetical protein